jgi:ferritin-like metal-binding protein YciE
MKTLNELFERTLKSVYYTEKAILKALAKIKARSRWKCRAPLCAV